MPGPLDGVRVLELGNFIAGPFAGQLLGDYGADVIKVESPGDGDPMRHWGVTKDGDSLWWPTIGRNKRSITLDLRTDDGRRIVRELAAKCDVVVENFRPGVLAKWGLTHDALAASHCDRVVFLADGKVVDELIRPSSEQILEHITELQAAAAARSAQQLGA